MPTKPLFRLWALDPQRLVVGRVAVAQSFGGRFMGLMLRPTIGSDEGLYLPGTNSIHMLFMRFPIDCLFLGSAADDGSHEVVSVRQHLPPWGGVVWWARGATGGVVELAAGRLRAAGVAVGDRVRFEATGE